MSDVQKMLATIDRVRVNPAAIQRTALELLEKTTNGEKDIVDPTNPFVFLLESAAIFSAAGMINDEAVLRKQYAVMAQTEEELYMHMSDKDYINRFSTPSTAPITFLFSKEEIYEKAVDTGIGSIRKIVIPRNTEITVAGTKFTMQYPIEIRIMAHGGLQIVYDVSKPSPLQVLSTNVVEWDIVTINRMEFVRMQVPVLQFEINTYYAHLSLSNAFVKSYDLPNDYYYCRIYASQTDGTWREILTTHTEQVFDPLKPTALLKVYNKTLQVKIPQIYQSTNLINRELRIDIYTTKGPIDIILNNYTPDTYSTRWLDIEEEDNGLYSAPLSIFTTLAVYSDSVVSGGSKGLTFTQLRERVLNNAFGSTNLPITNVQVGNLLNDLGYSVVKNVDTVTNRIFLATRRLPKPNDDTVASGASCSINTVTFKVSELVNQTETVIDNGERITLLPKTLYLNDGGLVRVVTDLERNELLSRPVELLTNHVNTQRFLYSPFLYVFDSSNNGFESRVYYLDSPAIDAKIFIEENDTIGVELGSREHSIEKVDYGYNLYIVTRSGVIVKELDDERVFAQLHFRPLNESSKAYLNGELVGKTDDGDRIYKFEIHTNYDISKEDGLFLTNFTMFSQVQQPNETPLIGEFELVLGVTGFTGADIKPSEIDNIIDNNLIIGDGRGVSHERFRVRFGWRLNTLWSNSRTVAGNHEYQRYTEDVLGVYAENVYERDPVTGLIKIELDADNNVVYNLLHAEGDPILDPDGNQIVVHLKGDPILDNDGNPIPISSRKLLRQVDLFMVEGNYYFATESISLEHKRNIPITIVNWLTQDLQRISSNLLEQTQMFFYPQDTQSDVKVIVKEGFETTMRAEQTFRVTYYLTRTGYANAELRTVLTRAAIDVITSVLQKKVITINEITSKLTATTGDDVIAVNVEGLGGRENYTAVTLVDDSARLTLKKRLTALADNNIAVEDDIDFVYLRHEV